MAFARPAARLRQLDLSTVAISHPPALGGSAGYPVHPNRGRRAVEVSFMPSDSTRPTFLERYCQHHQITPERYMLHLLHRSLHAPLRFVWPLWPSAFTDYLEPDIACVHATGKLTRRRELESELVEYSYHPRNRTFWRRILKQRLSTRRIRRILRELPDYDREG